MSEKEAKARWRIKIEQDIKTFISAGGKIKTYETHEMSCKPKAKQKSDGSIVYTEGSLDRGMSIKRMKN